MATFKTRATTQFIAIHCAATKPSMDIDAAWVDRLHRAQGWAGIGYHRFIKRDGTIQQGRPDDAVGAHVAGYNETAIGICMAGGVAEDGTTPEDNFTSDQFLSLMVVVKELAKKYPQAVVQGHRDFPRVAKACPSFDVKSWLAIVNWRST